MERLGHDVVLYSYLWNRETGETDIIYYHTKSRPRESAEHDVRAEFRVVHVLEELAHVAEVAQHVFADEAGEEVEVAHVASVDDDRVAREAASVHELNAGRGEAADVREELGAVQRHRLHEGRVLGAEPVRGQRMPLVVLDAPPAVEHRIVQPPAIEVRPVKQVGPEAARELVRKRVVRATRDEVGCRKNNIFTSTATSFVSGIG